LRESERYPKITFDHKSYAALLRRQYIHRHLFGETKKEKCSMKELKNHGDYASSNPHTLSPFGYPVLTFEDAQTIISEEGFFREREMVLEGKPFKIRSFFLPVSSESATKKLLRLIDTEFPERNR